MNTATERTLTIRKRADGRRWEVIGCPAGYGASDSDMSPEIPPSFKTRAAAVDFAARVVGRGEATGYAVSK